MVSTWELQYTYWWCLLFSLPICNSLLPTTILSWINNRTTWLIVLHLVRYKFINYIFVSLFTILWHWIYSFISLEQFSSVNSNQTLNRGVEMWTRTNHGLWLAPGWQPACCEYQFLIMSSFMCNKFKRSHAKSLFTAKSVWLASNFSLQYDPWITQWGHKLEMITN